ncbi:aminotransferase-like domain-containing protein [Paeniglutamicibacter gangotriensis]|uniref:aminotransferase-like domain-containing protein n=1 Tax=Paeniglutamicibacter gangotriensis TaxID=254787 RepID=UPI003741F0B4
MSSITGPSTGSETEIAFERAAAHESLFSERASHIKQSAVRDVFELSLDPSLVSLAGGNPYLQSLPLGKLGAMAAELIATEGMTALQYGSGQGTQELRTQICEVMAEEGITGVDPDNIVVTTGSQAAQDVACKVFCDPGDTVLCEDPTYVGALNTFEAYQVRAEPISTDEHGLIPEALSQRITELRGEGARIKFLYTIPNFNNPSGITLAAERRAQIAEICIAENILILEDNPYGMLRYSGEPIAPLYAQYPENVIYMGSFSKIMAPGLRIGWAVVPAHLFRRFYLAAEAVTLCPATFNQMLITKYLDGHDWRGQIATYRELYAARCAAMLDALDEHMPAGVHYTRPEGGFFIWVTLPEGIDSYTLLAKGIEAGVVFIPGAAFSPDDAPSHRLRLAFSAVPEDKIREGVKRLAPVLEAAIAEYSAH